MANLSWIRLYRAASFCAFGGSACVGSYGAFVLANGIAGHGSATGNLLMGTLGLFLILIALGLFTVGSIAWQKSKSI
jgi:hypothetical protein